MASHAIVVSAEMTSALKPPDPKKPLSVRIRGSSIAKLKVVVTLWQETLKAQGRDDAAEEIDTTFTVDHLLAKALDEELAQFGGWPDTEAKLAAALKQIRAGVKHQ